MFVTTAGQKRIHNLSDYGVDIREANADSVAWWLSGGVSAATNIAAYAFKGAASFAASLSNLNNPGTNNAIDPGGAATPAWTSANGLAAANGDYLATTIVPTNSYTAIVNYNSHTMAGSNKVVFGCFVAAAATEFAYAVESGADAVFANSATLLSTKQVSAQAAIAGKTAYYNGAPVGTIGAGSFSFALPLYILAINSLTGALQFMISGYVTSFAVYNSTLIDAQVAAISAAMP